MTTDTDLTALLCAIVEQPHDMAARLVYADLLEERGDPDGRGEFVRVQCELAGIRCGCAIAQASDCPCIVAAGRCAHEYDVPRIPADDHEHKNPVDELVGMVGKDRVIVVDGGR